MTPKKEWESIGSNPFNSRTASNIQSKAVSKDTQFRDLCVTTNPDLV